MKSEQGDFLMIKRAYLLFIFFALAMAALANGQESEKVEDLVKFLPVLTSAFKNGQWLMVGAVVALLFTFMFKKYVLSKLNLGTGILPIVSSVVGVVAGVSLAIVGGAGPDAAMLAVLSGPLASTLWDSLIKYFFKK